MPGEALALLDALRTGGPEAVEARRMLAHDATGRTAAERLREQVASALATDIRPTDRAVARWLLEQEIAAHATRSAGATETLFTLVAVVARFGQPADALMLWRAHDVTPETRAGVDVEQMGRLGLGAAKVSLARLVAAGGKESGEAAYALNWIAAGEREGAFNDLPDYFTWADERFGLACTGPT